MFDYTFQRKKYKKNVSFEKMYLFFFSLEIYLKDHVKNNYLII